MPQPSALNILREVFGYHAFRGRQEEIVNARAEGQNLLVLMPTGGGKSLCYQIPALMRRGLAGVVSRIWTNWLISDGERLRRTTQPRTGRTPWIMPGDLNQPELLALPPALTEKLRPEPVGPFPG